jgi:hypothetical protein
LYDGPIILGDLPIPTASGVGSFASGKSVARMRLTCRLVSKRTNKRKLSKKKKANHGKKPNCGRG